MDWWQIIVILLEAIFQAIITSLNYRAVMLSALLGVLFVVVTVLLYFVRNNKVKKFYTNRLDRSYEYYKSYKAKGEYDVQHSDDYIEQSEKYREKTKSLKKQYAVYVAIEMVVCILFIALGVTRTPQDQTGEVTTASNNAQGRNENTESSIDKGEFSEESMDTDTQMGYGHIGFILMEPDRLLELSYSQMRQIFYITSAENEDKIDAVEQHLAGLSDEKRINRSYEWTKVESSIIDETSKSEALFDDKKKEAQIYESNDNYEGWSYAIPSSDKLDKIIYNRKTFWSENPQEDRCNSEVAFLVANDYQEYALEYEKQKGRFKTVIYYYGVSIIWTERALTYEDVTPADIEVYCDYILARYKDISDFILKNRDKIPEDEIIFYNEVQSKAKEMYDAMSSYMNQKK